MSAGSKKRSALPPVRQEQWRDIGSSASRRPRTLIRWMLFATALMSHTRRGRRAANLLGHASDTARTEQQHDVVVAGDIGEHRGQLLRFGHEQRVDLAAQAHCAAQRAPVGAGDRVFAGRVDFEHEQPIGAVENLDKIFEQVTN